MTPSPSRSLLKRAVLGVVVLALATTGTVAAAPAKSKPQPPARTYYVSVGTSLASGVQPIGDPNNLYRTTDGYAEQLLAIAQATMPKLKLVKLGCPGETTTTMMKGGICSYPHGSQLDEAVAFLHAHRSKVAFITIDMGANDFACQEPQCLADGVAMIQANLPKILDRLRKAAGPETPIVGMTLHNPFLGMWLTGPDGQVFARMSATQMMGPVNALLRGIFLAGGADVADVETAFSSNDFDTMVELPGPVTVPLNVARICMWTWVCAPPPLGPNNHPNASGYGVMARAFAWQLGF
jgi:lysophospholipase L1-like esterase